MPYMDFILGKQIKGKKTDVWKVVSVQGSCELGIVAWHPHWRRYVFWPSQGTIFDAACLKDLAYFLEKQTELQKSKRGG